jgi:DNA-binding CsgD family transcriptional regulator
VARLLEADYRKALEVVYAAGEVEGPVAFSEPVLQALRELVPCDVATFHERSESPVRVLVFAGDPLGEKSPEIQEAHCRLEYQDPFRPAEGPRTLTDFVSLREFRRTEFYGEVHRPLGIEYMLQLYLDPGRTDARLEFDRADSDFGERDRDVLTLLLPYLRRFLRVSERQSPETSAHGVLTPREREVLEHVADGRTNSEVAAVLGISQETVRKHLENSYSKLDVHTRTGAVAAAIRHGQRG